MKPPAPCGTYPAYQRHLRRREPIDDPCREAANAYMAAYRATPAGHAREAATTAARSRAMTRLARMHPADFRAIYDEEIGKTRPPQPDGSDGWTKGRDHIWHATPAADQPTTTDDQPPDVPYEPEGRPGIPGLPTT